MPDRAGTPQASSRRTMSDPSDVSQSGLVAAATAVGRGRPRPHRGRRRRPSAGEGGVITPAGARMASAPTPAWWRRPPVVKRRRQRRPARSAALPPWTWTDNASLQEIAAFETDAVRDPPLRQLRRPSMLPDALWQERVAGVRETYGTLIDTVALASRASRVLHYRLCLLSRLSGIHTRRPTGAGGCRRYRRPDRQAATRGNALVDARRPGAGTSTCRRDMNERRRSAPRPSHRAALSRRQNRHSSRGPGASARPYAMAT
jgi:hypothetical protein